MLEIIQQNPVISLIIILVPIIAGAWKVMEVLFIKPRDFRIAVLERNVEEIRKQIQKDQDKQETLKPSPEDVHTEEKPSDVINDEPKKLKSMIESASLLNDIDLFYDSWRDEKLTELQRDQFEKSFIGQKIIWTARFSSVSEERDGYLWVSLTSKKKDHFGVHVIAVFEAPHKEALLVINKDEIVTVSGTITSFSLSPLISKCAITRTT